MTKGQWARVVSVFERARGLPPDEVKLLLDETLAGEEVLAREVQDLLAADGVGFPLLDESRAIGGVSVGTARATRAVTMPDQLGPYRLLAELGRGGMGVVYLAEREDVELRVALKLLPRGSASEDGLRRFEYERRVLARLEHPSIARLMDAGITPDGSPWFAMEYVRGQPIDVHCDIHQYTVAQRLDLMEKVGRAVAYAHRNLIIHRDLKPSNVLVNGAGVPKLVDFGIAKLLHTGAEADGSLTQAGARVLTPNYASPEQVQGTVLTTASDVYQLGILAHELLVGVRPRSPTGQPISPWSRARPLSPSELLSGPYPGGAGAVREVAMRRSTRPAALRSELRADVDHVILKALEPNPDDRYPAAQQLVEDLERYRIGHPVQAHPGSFARRLWKAASRHRIVSALGAAVALVVSLSVVGFAYQARRIASERDQAERAAEVLASIIQRADPAGAAADSALAAGVLEEARRQALAGLDEDPVRWGPVVLAIASAHRSGGDPASAIELQQATVDRLPAGHPAHLEAMSQLGTTLVETGDFDTGIPYLERAADGARSLPEERRAELGDYLADLGFGRQVEGALGEADVLYEEALQILSSLPDSGGDQLNRVLINRGYLVRARGDEAAAEALIRVALDRRTRDLGADHVRTANAAASLGEVLLVRGNLGAADSLSASALAVRQSTFTDANGPLAAALDLRGRVLAALGRTSEGEALMRQALEMGRQVYGEPHVQVAFTSVNLGLVLVELGRVDEAIDLLRTGLDQYEQSVGPDHHAALSAAVELADAERARGRLEVARDLMDRAMPKLEEQLSAGSRLAGAYVVQGLLLRDSGRCPDALEALTRAIELGAAVWPEDHPIAVRAHRGLADCGTG